MLEAERYGSCKGTDYSCGSRSASWADCSVVDERKGSEKLEDYAVEWPKAPSLALTVLESGEVASELL